MHQEKQAPLCILGIGSPFGYDRTGWWAVDFLRQAGIESAWPGEVKLEVCDRPGAELLYRIKDCEVAILIDAVCADEITIGSLLHLTPEQLNSQSGITSSHGFGVTEALQLGAVLGVLPSRLVIFGIVVSPDESGEQVPAWWLPTMQRLLSDVTDAIEQSVKAVSQPLRRKL